MKFIPRISMHFALKTLLLFECRTLCCCAGTLSSLGHFSKHYREKTIPKNSFSRASMKYHANRTADAASSYSKTTHRTIITVFEQIQSHSNSNIPIIQKILFHSSDWAICPPKVKIPRNGRYLMLTSIIHFNSHDQFFISISQDGLGILFGGKLAISFILAHALRITQTNTNHINRTRDV